MHGLPPVKDDLEYRFQLDDLGIGGQRRIFAQGVAGEVRLADKDFGFTQPGSLGERERGEGDLGELSEMEDAFGMPIGGPPGSDLLRVVTYERDDRCLLYTSPSPRDRTRSRM